MKLTLDSTDRTLTITDADSTRTVPLYSPDAFSALSRWWVKVGWELKYTYSFTWMGRPIIQLPEDVVTAQEVIYRVKPDVIIETGVAHGGSLIFYASLLKAMGRGRVVGVDIEIRPHNRAAIERHELSSLITLIEGSSTAPETLEKVRLATRPGETVLVFLDSDHSRRHVADELEVYAPLVTKGSYIVATDGLMEFLDDVPRGRPGWATDNPKAAAAEFVLRHPEFQLQDPPPISFNEGKVTERITHWPGAYLQRVR